ncbi:aminoglycoside phosphotransferase family protein [Candidatus Kaiserbacteria bacterium]|uniref:Aminoglycoside phosphotransferase family protein n=1 Tax=candidate division WWE3 bacterium TaxID=2053526 RepID=A0A955LW46_UNCKA|nr:aminoglycoside phosphotransferase family protein [Candidatus Kaiserbacteria bacterium]MCA9397757.1 aminoglycoside phosphotransferase family protein [candidate division WWE3 bacterium]
MNIEKTTGEKSEEIDESLINTIAAEYNLPDLHFVSMPKEGINSHNMILQKPGGNTYFLKQYREHDAERREDIHRIENYIFEHSTVPVVRPLPNISGEPHTYVKGKMFALFAYIESAEVHNETEEQRLTKVESLAETLGKTHAIPVTEEIKDLDTIDRWDSSDCEKRLRTLEEIEGIIRAKDELDDYDTRSLTIIELKKSLLSEAASSDKQTVNLGLCHGDYHRHNVLFDEHQQVIGVCDWDNAGLSDTYIDFLDAFRTSVIRSSYDTYRSEQRETARAFIKGYINGKGGTFDGSRLKDAMEVYSRHIVGTAWPMNVHYFNDFTKSDSALDSMHEKATFYAEYQEEVVDFIMEIYSEMAESTE